MNNTLFSPNEKEICNVQKLRPQQKYTYFVGKIADWEQVWAISDGNSLITVRNGMHDLSLPLWSAKAYVEQCLTGEWAHFSPILFSLEHLMTEVLPDMHEANIKVAIMMQPDRKNILLYDAARLLSDLQEECQQYE
ncbi:DUF2750 domain-containing protein [Providencia rettgeri]|nr:DUF2750 domain-containing protein [Providencia rettgeri]